MQRRIFIGISLPEDIKKRLVQRVEKWQDLPIKWLKNENFHITLAFLGYVDDIKIGEICSGVKEAVGSFQSFDVFFEKIGLGPNVEEPRMVWISGGVNEELRKLQEAVEKTIGTFIVEKKEFRPHITLGKIRKHKWEDLAERPEIKENLRVSIPVENVEVFESRIENGKRRYDVLEICPLK